MLDKKKYAGFTLIELLVVIAVIALLMAIIIPGLKLAKDYAKRVVCASRLRQVGIAMVNYSQSYAELPGSDKYPHGYAVYRDDYIEDGKYVPMRWAILYEAGYMELPELFYCPGNRMNLFKYESYSTPEPWGSLPQDYNDGLLDGTTHNQWIRVGYTYFPIPSGTPRWDEEDSLTLAEKFVQLNPGLPYATDILHHRSVISHQRSQDDDDTYKESSKYSLNALYVDAHVSNCNDRDVFKDPIWDTFSDNYDKSYYTIFKLIGAQ